MCSVEKHAKSLWREKRTRLHWLSSVLAHVHSASGIFSLKHRPVTLLVSEENSCRESTSFSKTWVFNFFSVHIKTQSHVFNFLQFEERFLKAQISWRISWTVGRTVETKLSFHWNFFGVVWRGLTLFCDKWLFQAFFLLCEVFGIRDIWLKHHGIREICRKNQ